MESKAFKLIDGQFQVSNAKEILFDVINSKINFHNTKILSLRIKDWNGCVKSSQDRINELTETKEKIFELLNLAYDKDAMVEISSSVSIKIIDKVGDVQESEFGDTEKS